MKIKRYILISALFLFNFAYACTDFILVDEEKNIVIGRSMDCRLPLDYEIVIVPKNQKKISQLENNEKGMSWTSKYAYIGITILNSELLVDGMNEKGLSMDALWFADSKYPANITKNENTLALEDISNWILGSFANVDEVKEGLKKVNFWVHYINQAQNVPKMHFAFHDKAGKSIALEFIDGKMEVIDNPVGVLTNSPKLDWQMKNLGNYIHLSAYNRDAVQVNGTIITPDEQGTGLLGMPGDWTSPSRFVKIAYIKSFAKPAKNALENTNLAFHILNVVDIPYGLIRPAKDRKDLEYTQWISVKDLSNLKLFYRTYNDMNVYSIDFLTELKKLKDQKIKIPMNGTKKV
ncbi:MAG: choloylglycine hydrolase family protein [Parachlamydiales bacterium]|jgi:choloylglycine hydrolase